MTRFLVPVMLAAMAVLPAIAQAPECDAHSQLRGDEVQQYVPRAMACIETPRAGFWYDERIEYDMLARANNARAQAGLPPLLLRAELRAPARLHSFDMAQDGFFAHIGPDGRTPFQRISALDRTLVQSETRENLASVTGDLDDSQISSLLHNLLMDSPSHKDNILAPNVTHMAIGLVRTAKGAWVTQLFVRQDGTLTEPLKIAHKVGDPLAFDANLSGRDLAGAAFLGPRGREYTSFTGPEIPSGDLQLLLIGQRWIDERTRKNIKLNGPSISLVR
jgi:hypothetical protein